MDMILHPTSVHTDAFTYDSATRTFSAEDSSLPRPSRVWDDACDVGYTLISTRTNRGIIVAIEEEKRDREGDITHWVLRPIDRSQRNLFTVHIFND